MKRFAILAGLALLTLAGVIVTSCGDDKVVTQTSYLLYYDVIGNAEFESDGTYPPPDNLDNAFDDLITVRLYFGEDFNVGEVTYGENEIYGFYITSDDTPGDHVNFSFPFVPDGTYYLTAEFVSADSCFFAQSTDFAHTDTSHSEIDLRPLFLGQNQDCYDVILTAAQDEMVQVGERFFVTRKVYDQFYKDRENRSPLEP